MLSVLMLKENSLQAFSEDKNADSITHLLNIEVS